MFVHNMKRSCIFSPLHFRQMTRQSLSRQIANKNVKIQNLYVWLITMKAFSQKTCKESVVLMTKRRAFQHRTANRFCVYVRLERGFLSIVFSHL